VFDTRHSSMLS